MSPKKRILRELVLAHEPGSPFSFVRPSDIPGYGDTPARFHGAVNDLLKERLIEGRTDAEGRLSIGLNEHRMGEVRRALRPVWAKPTAWVVGAILVAVGIGLAA